MLKLIKILIIILLPLVLLLSNLGFVFYNEVNKYEDLKGFFNSEDLIGYSEKEKVHMQEVKDLVNNLKILLIISLVLLISLLSYLFKINKKEFYISLLIGSGLTILICLMFIIFSLIDFNLFFTYFHKLFFRSNNWLLNESDRLIQMFPSNFFYLAGLKLFFFVVIESLIIGLFSWFKIKK